jgi:hypothetical protein
MSRDYSYMRFSNNEDRIELCLERKIRKSGYAGFISSKHFNDIIVIFVNDTLLDENCIRRGYIAVQDDGTHPEIILDTATFNGIKRGVATARFLLFHEIGHYFCGHFKEKSTLKDEFCKRNTLLKNYEVATHEVEADCFGAEYLGAEYVIRALQDSMEQRMTNDLFCGTLENAVSQMAMREYQLRIDAVQEHFGIYQNDEE